MKVTFLVGNGFDRAAGLATGYNDFYKWYCKKEPGTANIKEFKSEIEGYLDSLVKKADEATEESEETYLWSDLEYGLGQCTEKIFKNRAKDFLECYEDIHDSMNEYIALQNQRVDLENIPENQIIKLKKGLATFYDELSPAEKQTIKSVFDSRRGENCEVQFLTFNYTDTLGACVRELSKTPIRTWNYGNVKCSMNVIPTLVHVHGKIGYYPIMGVSDKSQIANKDFHKDEEIIENLVKPTSVNAIGELWHQEAESAIMGSDMICIFGMSLGCTDAKWWSIVINWLKNSASRHLIVFWYTETVNGTVSILKKKREERKAKGQLLKYLDDQERNNPKIRNRIHVVMNTKKVLQCKLNIKPEESLTLQEFLDQSTSLQSIV